MSMHGHYKYYFMWSQARAVLQPPPPQPLTASTAYEV